MSRLNIEQIRRNQKTAADNALESPWNEGIQDSDADYPQAAFDNEPVDDVGFLPSNRKQRK